MSSDVAVPAELRVGVDAAEMALGYDDGDGRLAVDIALDPAGVATLVLDTDQAREWAGGLFAAVSVAYREATGDPHALTDHELACLPDPSRYVRGGGSVVHGTCEPAQVRFTIALTVQGQVLDTAALAEAIVETLSDRFRPVDVRVDAGTPISGDHLTPPRLFPADAASRHCDAPMH